MDVERFSPGLDAGRKYDHVTFKRRRIEGFALTWFLYYTGRVILFLFFYAVSFDFYDTFIELNRCDIIEILR